jgi:DNA-binding NarL/FixJ family response regulator
VKGVRILVVDDHGVVRRGVRALVETRRGWKVVGEAVDGREAINKAKQLQPDIVVMDITMNPMSGLEATPEILKVAPRSKILFLTMHESEQVVREVLKAGAQGYVLKSDADRDLMAALEALQGGETFFTSKVARMVLQGFLGGNPPAHDASSLTPRQREVLQYLAAGKSNKEVASALNISVKTVETHRNSIMHKLDFRSFADLVRYAVRERIIES